MSNFQNDSIFWIEVEKIKPNPYQPRKEFSDDKLNYLAESIRQYGVLQPLVVTRQEVEKPEGGLMAEYELIAGERRLRASKIAGLSQVPAIIRTETQDNAVKLELAIIENLQREDLNPIDRATAFQKLVDEFGLKHVEIGKKMGKSREYVSNSLRLLTLPEEMRNALAASQISEGHARPLMMLRDKPEEQMTLFKEILYKKLTVRDAEAIAKKVAYDKVRRKTLPPDPEMMELEGQLAESLGTRVQIERKEVGGKLTIDFFSSEDLKKILDLVHSNDKKSPTEMLDNYIQSNNIVQDSPSAQETQTTPQAQVEEHPHASVEEEVATRPMAETTDTATDEVDEETQLEIQDEAKIVQRDSVQTVPEEKVVVEEAPTTESVEEIPEVQAPAVEELKEETPTEEVATEEVKQTQPTENVSSPTEVGVQNTQAIKVESAPSENVQTPSFSPETSQSEPVVEEKVGYMNVGKDFKMPTEPKKEETVPLDEDVEVVVDTPNNQSTAESEVVEKVDLNNEEGGLVSGNVEMVPGSNLEKTDVESAVPTSEVVNSQNPQPVSENTNTPNQQNPSTEGSQEKKEEDLYSVKDFNI